MFPHTKKGERKKETSSVWAHKRGERKTTRKREGDYSGSPVQGGGSKLRFYAN